jgi:hypothetical protein
MSSQSGSSGSSDDDEDYDNYHNASDQAADVETKRYPVHDACEFEDIDALRVRVLR